MHKIDGAGNDGGSFVHENYETGRPPTEVTADWLNAVQEELLNVIKAGGLPLDKMDNTQVITAINNISRKWDTRFEQMLAESRTFAFTKGNDDFESGCLIRTSLDSIAPWELEIKCKTFNQQLPIDFNACGTGDFSYIDGTNAGLSLNNVHAFNLDGKICFWFPPEYRWYSISVFVTSVNHTGPKVNFVKSIHDGQKPTNITNDTDLTPHIKQLGSSAITVELVGEQTLAMGIGVWTTLTLAPHVIDCDLFSWSAGIFTIKKTGTYRFSSALCFAVQQVSPDAYCSFYLNHIYTAGAGNNTDFSRAPRVCLNNQPAYPFTAPTSSGAAMAQVNARAEGTTKMSAGDKFNLQVMAQTNAPTVRSVGGKWANGNQILIIENLGS